MSIKKNIKNKAGRKLFDGKNETDVIQKLESVWALGGTDAEAAFYADISKAALSEYLTKHPDISERKEALKNNPILLARKSVLDGIKIDPDLALKYLERKCKDEFSTKVITDNKNTNTNTDTEVSLILKKLNINDIRDIFRKK
jgi:hypothetical protein